MFTIDFSKAFDSVNHQIPATKLKTSLYTHILSVGGVAHDKVICDWKHVNKGTTRGSMSGPYLFNIFLNDLEMSMGWETVSSFTCT